MRSSGVRSRGRGCAVIGVVLAFAFVFAGVLVAAAFATGLADRFSSWVSGSPGRPAPARVQRGFEQRNRAAYASFPAGRSCDCCSAEGGRHDLQPARVPKRRCVLPAPDPRRSSERDRPERMPPRRRALGIPALVAGDAWFSIEKPAKRISGVYGFASDDVRSVVIVRARGSERVPVVNNVFLSLGAPGRGQRPAPSAPKPGAGRPRRCSPQRRQLARGSLRR